MPRLCSHQALLQLSQRCLLGTHQLLQPLHLRCMLLLQLLLLLLCRSGGIRLLLLLEGCLLVGLVLPQGIQLLSQPGYLLLQMLHSEGTEALVLVLSCDCVRSGAAGSEFHQKEDMARQ